MAVAKDSNGFPMPVLSWIAVQNVAIGASSTQSAALPDDAMAVLAGIPDPDVAATIDDTDSYELLRRPPPGHSCGGLTFGVVGTITPLVDIWLDGGRLHAHVRAAPRD